MSDSLSLQPFDPALFQRVWNRVMPDQSLSPIALTSLPAPPVPPVEAETSPLCFSQSSNQDVSYLEQTMDSLQDLLWLIHHLLSRSPAPVHRSLRSTYTQLQKAQRRLSSAYFLLEGQWYLPQQLQKEVQPSIPLGLRSLYFQLQTFLHSSPTYTDPCLQTLNQEIAHTIQTAMETIPSLLEYFSGSKRPYNF